MPRASTARRLLLIGMSVLSATATAGAPQSVTVRANDIVRANDTVRASDIVRGQALFTGKADLTGRIYTHRVDLPAAVVRCGNCHAANDGPVVPRSLAPRLNPDLLTRKQPRRGGPASAYDGQKFCTLLRRGLDPAFVLISVEMPRYTIDDADCLALWNYLNEAPGGDER